MACTGRFDLKSAMSERALRKHQGHGQMRTRPKGFGALADFVGDWALEATEGRIGKRGTSSPEQIKAFHTAMIVSAPAVLEYFNAKDIYRLDGIDGNLMKLVLAPGQWAMAVEVQRTTHQPGITYPHGIRVTHDLPLPG